jgi:hypothetical protein
VQQAAQLPHQQLLLRVRPQHAGGQHPRVALPQALGGAAAARWLRCCCCSWWWCACGWWHHGTAVSS